MNLEQHFIGKISGNLAFFRQMPNSTYKFQCPYCQTSGRHKSGRALKDGDCASYFYEKQSVINFRCHKCGIGKQFHTFLKDHFPNEFIAYVQERERRGTTGKGHNCPTLANALESVGKLKFGKPVFDKQHAHQEPTPPQEEESSRTQQDRSCGNPPKVQILPRMRSPQQQAGCQAHINRLIKQKHERARRRRGDLWWSSARGGLTNGEYMRTMHLSAKSTTIPIILNQHE